MLSSRPIDLHGDGLYFPTKTPGRGLKNRAENAHAGRAISMTVHGKGKESVAPKTPFQPSSVQPQRLFKDQKIVLSTTTRPLGDKTPLPNRIGTTLFQTPGPQKSKLSKLVLVDAGPSIHPSGEDGNKGDDDGNTPESTQRPSSMRKHIKHPRFSGPKNFETPMNKGNHWDVSDGDIVVPESQALMQETIMEDEDDLDEVEYGAPNTLDLPYQPPFDFDLPDYKKVGRSLRQLAFSYPCYDIPAPPAVEVPVSDLESITWDMIMLPAIESDDPFDIARREAAGSLPPVAPTRHTKAISIGTRHATVGSIGSKPRPQSSLARLGIPNKVSVSRPTTKSALPLSRATGTNPGAGATKSSAPGAGNQQRATSSSSLAAKHSKTSSISTVATSRSGVTAVKKPVFGSAAGVSSRPKAVAAIPASQRCGPSVKQLRPHTSLSLTSKTAAAGLSSKPSVARFKPSTKTALGQEDGLIRLTAIAANLMEEDFMFDV